MHEADVGGDVKFVGHEHAGQFCAKFILRIGDGFTLIISCQIVGPDAFMYPQRKDAYGSDT